MRNSPVLAVVSLVLVASPAMAQSQPGWTFSIGPWAGYNISEANDSGSDKSSTLVGLRF